MHSLNQGVKNGVLLRVERRMPVVVLLLPVFQVFSPENDMALGYLNDISSGGILP